MLDDWVIVAVSLAYLGTLFAVAWFADRRADSGRPVTRSPYVYTLSIGVYCTAWTFYGSVGRAAGTGVAFQIDVEDVVGIGRQISKLTEKVEEKI